MNELVSIIVPVYNVEKYLIKCLNSLIEQTYKNLEIILVDDGSQDNSGNICDKYKQKDSRIRVIHIENSGVSNARNIGLDNMKGQYTMFVDSDDYVSKNMVEELYNSIKKNEADISICGVENIYENGENRTTFKEGRFVTNGEKALGELLNGKYFTSVCWGKMYKSELWKNIRFNKDTKIAEDLEVLYYIFERAKKVVVDTKNKLYYYIVRENSAIHTSYNEDWEKEILISKKIIEKVQLEHPNILKLAIKRYIIVNMNNIIRIKENHQDTESIKKLQKNIKPYLKNFLFNKNVRLKIKIKLILMLLNII